jgi:hypothetical protein
LDAESNARLYDRLRQLVSHLGDGLTSAEFTQSVIGLGQGSGGRSLPLNEAVLAVLIRNGASDVLLGEVRHILVSASPTQTVKRLAAHASRDRSTLRRHWKRVCPTVDLHDFLRLTVLVHLARAGGSDRARARACGIDVRTARKAALEVVRKPLGEVMQEPALARL